MNCNRIINRVSPKRKNPKLKGDTIMKKKNIGHGFGKLVALAAAICLLSAAVMPLTAHAAYAESEDDLVLLRVESIYEWNEGFAEPTALVEKTEGAPDGSKYVSTTATGVAMLSRAFEAVDVSAYADGYFHLFLYVQDVSKLTGGQIELTSSGNADSYEMNWDVTSLGLVNGWNELYLQMSTAGEQNGKANLSAINYFRVYFLFNDSMEVGIDHMSMTKEIKHDDPSADPVPPATEDKLLLAVGNIYEWNEGFIEPSPLTMKTEGAPDGEAYVSCVGTDVAMMSRAFTEEDLTAYKTGYLHLYLYVEDVAKLTGGQVELTSARNADVNEIHWNIMDLGLVNGWNELFLPIANAEEQGGAIDFRAVNYFRVFFLYSGTMETGIDNISVTNSNTPKNPDNPPKTGDPMTVFAVLMAVSGLGIAVAASQKKSYCK